MKQDNGQISRIEYFESIFDEISEALKGSKDMEKLKPKIRELEEYYGSDIWKKDLADDESGLLPQGLKRGVLSEDGIYDLLEEIGGLEENGPVFREVARVRQKLGKDECIKILKNEKRGVLSVIGDGGYPYGMPLNHYYCEDDGKIYFHSGKTGHKIDALRSCDKVSYCVFGSGIKDENGWALNFKSVIVFGRVEFIEDRERIYDISAKLSRKFTDDEDYIKREIEKYGPATLMFAIVPEHITGKKVREE